jgi:D-3-phosphoglycerate dehydrogenase
MKRILFLQDLGIRRNAVDEAIAGAGLEMEAAWEAPDQVEAPESIAAIVTVNMKVDATILDWFPNVRVVSVAFTGYDVVDVAACRERDVAVTNVPAYSTDSVAELVLGLTVSLLRRIPEGDRTIRDGGWEMGGPGTELAGKKVGILGTGAIGLRVAELFKACRCELIGWSKTLREEFKALGGEYRPLEELFSTADIITVHVPLTGQTRWLIGRSLLERMKPKAVLVNAARGPIVDQGALAELLEEGRVGGAAIDVFDPEPLPAEHPLRSAPNTVLMPHQAYRTGEALVRRARVAMRNIKVVLDGGKENRVD